MEKLKVLLLFGILVVLIVIAFRPRTEVGRFVNGSLDAPVALDTKTGLLCRPLKDDRVVPSCLDLR